MSRRRYSQSLCWREPPTSGLGELPHRYGPTTRIVPPIPVSATERCEVFFPDPNPQASPPGDLEALTGIPSRSAVHRSGVLYLKEGEAQSAAAASQTT